MSSGVNISHLVMVFNEHSCVDVAVVNVSVVVVVVVSVVVVAVVLVLVALGPGLIDAFII